VPPVLEPDLRVGVVEGLDQLRVDPRLLLVGEVIRDVPALVELMPTSA
jgi:hypothetical protein